MKIYTVSDTSIEGKNKIKFELPCIIINKSSFDMVVYSKCYTLHGIRAKRRDIYEALVVVEYEFGDYIQVIKDTRILQV